MPTGVYERTEYHRGINRESHFRYQIDVENLKSRYLNGETTVSLSNEYGCDVWVIMDRLKKAGITKFRRGFQKGHKIGRKNKYVCSDETREKLRKQKLGSKNPQWKDAKVKFMCEICKKEFNTYLNGRKKLRFCSNKCAHEDEEFKARSRENIIKAIRRGMQYDTSIERKMENWLLFNNILYVKQYPYKLGVADFWLPEDNIIIECDGDYWHNPKYFPKVVERNKRQSKWLENNDYVVFRFSESEIKNVFDDCVNKLEEIIGGK